MTRKILKRDVPDVEMIEWAVAYDFKEKTVSAICELIDNSLGEAAGNASAVCVRWDTGSVLIEDNGRGIKDGNLSVMVKLGDSFSRLHDADIGQFGIGGKVGALYLGYGLHLKSVTNAAYYEHSVDWEKVKRRKQWPATYLPKPLALSKAPPTLGDGGTQIVITQRHSNRPLRFETLAERLPRIYRPALLQGRQICLVDIDGKKLVRLQAAPVALQHEVILETNYQGMPYRIRAGDLVDRGPGMQPPGLHMSYGHRVIHRYNNFAGKRVMPATFYAEVDLSKAWKTCLTATKNALAHYEQELLQHIAEELRDLLDLLDEKGRELQLDYFSTTISNATASLLDALNRSQQGDAGDGPRASSTVSGGNGKEPHGTNTPRDPKPDHAPTKKAPAKRGCKVRFAALGPHIAHNVSVSNYDTVITMNRENLAVKKVALEEWNGPAVMVWVVHALIDHLIDNPADAQIVLPSLAHALADGGDRQQLRQAHIHDALNQPNPVLNMSAGQVLQQKNRRAQGKRAT